MVLEACELCKETPIKVVVPTVVIKAVANPVKNLLFIDIVLSKLFNLLEFP
ncbi:hypothetical protein CWATWH8502_1706 [Crocosphaera watsonii WH 8502]|uniref:Uncharacterized protein n=1 Tax=Crocosphaera watsonii WH 8502 TaxID=423474 RepID=T2IM75_CROWT|nr:hypothetical protein CWATWH8502_1706 [Crocosphaera watsonii WH 8502]